MSLASGSDCTDISELKELVELNDRLKQISKNDSTISFASIVLVGEQSHGKTSLIENLTNLNLPSGSGMQTRVPMEIQLRHGPSHLFRITYTPKGQQEARTEECSEQQIETVLRQAQTDVVGNTTDLAEGLITLTIEKPDLLPLTFIDLPGYVIQNFNTSQNAQTVQSVLEAMYAKYLNNENNTLLCIINAAIDIHTSKVFQLCRQADPSGERTMICVTKLDLRPGSGYQSYRDAATQFGIGKVFFVKNKSEQEKNSQTPFEAVRQSEQGFLKGHPELATFPSEMKGIAALRDCLVNTQKGKIIPCIKENYYKVVAKRAMLEAQSRTIGQTIEDDAESAKFIKLTLNHIFKELREIYFNIAIDIVEQDSYVRIHPARESGLFEVFFPRRQIRLEYSLTSTGTAREIAIRSREKLSLCFKLSNDAGLNEQLVIDVDRVFNHRVTDQDLIFELRPSDEKDFVRFNESTAQVNKMVEEIYKLEHFINKDFVNTYNAVHSATYTGNMLPDSESDSIIEAIIRKHYLPKCRSGIETFRLESEGFARELFLRRVRKQFGEYPALVREIERTIHDYFAPKFELIRQCFEIFIENIYNVATTDPQYVQKVKQVTALFENSTATSPNDYIKTICPGAEFDFLQQTYRENPKVFRTAVRVWSYLSVMCVSLKDNVIKTVKNHFVREPVNNLEEIIKERIILDVLPAKKSKTLMKPNEAMHRRREELRRDLDCTNEVLSTLTFFRDNKSIGADLNFVDDFEETVPSEGSEKEFLVPNNK